MVIPSYSVFATKNLNPHPDAAKKTKKRWKRFDPKDPNTPINMQRAEEGMPPIDYWKIGVEYVYNSTPLASSAH